MIVDSATPGALVVAVSGGADSAAAAWLAVDSGRPTRAVYVHHGAPASDRLERAAWRITERLGIDLTVVSVVVPDGPSYESQARAVRHQAFDGCLDGDDWLVTGHTRDDQVETLLMRLVRGTGIDGLAGMAVEDRPYLRPLLEMTRSAARELATLTGLEWRDDPSNRDPRHLRNRIRRQMLPQLETAFGVGVATSLHRTSGVIRRDIEVLQELASGVRSRSCENGMELSLSDLRQVGTGVAARAVRNAIRALDPPYPPPSRVVEIALDVALGRSKRAEIGRLVIHTTSDWLTLSTEAWVG